MGRKFVPLTREQVDAAIRGDLKLITLDGRKVERVTYASNEYDACDKLTVNLKNDNYNYIYCGKGNYCISISDDKDLCIYTEPKTVKVNETVMGLKEALIFISNMITEQ